MTLRSSNSKPGAPPESVAARARRALDLEVRWFAEAGGRGPDEYCDDDRVHPMAEGRFLSTVATMLEIGGFDDAELRTWAEESVARLAATAITLDPERIGWGLGFEWKEVSADEPFVITTCIVAEGLKAASSQIGPAGEELRDRGLAWLQRPQRDFEVEIDSVRVPTFSPRMRQTPWNVLAAWTSHLEEGDPRRDVVRSLVTAARVPGLGWCYDRDSMRLDLLHQGYTIAGVEDGLDEDRVVEWILESLAGFSAPAGWVDKLDIVDEPAARDLRGRPGFLVHPCGEGRHLVTHPSPARSWSLGESLRLASRRSADPQLDVALRRASGSLVEAVLDRLGDEKTSHWPRATMHLALGLATFIASRRQSRGGV